MPKVKITKFRGLSFNCMIVLWGVLRDVFPDSGRVPGQHWHQKIECNLHVYLWLFMDTLTASPQDSLAPKPYIICRHFYSVYRKDAVLQNLFCPAEYCVSRAMCCETWRSQPPVIVIDLCCKSALLFHSNSVGLKSSYIYIYMIQVWLLC